MEERKRKRGDRNDGYRVRNLDSMHIMMPYLLPRRADNEAVANVLLDLSAVEKYLAEKNAEAPEYKYTLFHVISAALAKTIALRPRMNRFISGFRYYDRKEISISFVAKKEFKDDAHESIVIMKIDRETELPLTKQIHDKVTSVVHSIRKENKSVSTSDTLDFFKKMPNWLMKFIVCGVLGWMDNHGKVPKSLQADDPYHTTVFISNLGSIKMSASYHHLTNWGTNSFFVVIGEKKPTPFFNDDGSYEMRPALELGMTIDERIADGVYFAASIKLFKKLIASPELLDLPIMTPIDD